MADLTSKLKTYLKQESNLWYDIAITAYEIYRTQEWKKRGYSNINEYIEHEFKDIGISYRMFMYRVKMGEAIYRYDLKKEQLLHIGWTKFREVASFLLLGEEIPEEEINEVISVAEEMPAHEFTSFVRKKKRELKGVLAEVPEMEVKARFYGDQVPIIEKALKIAFEFANTQDIATALLYIATDFLVNHSTEDEVIEKIREQVIEKISQKPQKITAKMMRR